MIERFLLRLKKSARASLVDAIRGLCGLLLAPVLYIIIIALHVLAELIAG